MAGDQVAPPHLDRVEIELCGDGIHQPLAHEGALEAAGRAIGAARRLVGQPDMRMRAIGRNAIRPRQHRGGEIGHRRRVGAHIGALIVKNLVVDGENAPSRSTAARTRCCCWRE